MKPYHPIDTVTRLIELAKESLEGTEDSGKFCGLKTSIENLNQILTKLNKNAEIYTLKTQHPDFPLVLSLEGGTGTGKSTIFNALVGSEVSLTGSERPKTFGPILFSHEDHKELLMKANFLSAYEKEFLVLESNKTSVSGDPLKMKIILHERNDLHNLFIIDTPDIDSVETFNRKMAEDIYDVSDIILFVTSEEKYGDRLPFKLFQQAMEDEKGFMIIMNKVNSEETFRELRERVLASAKSPVEEDRFFSLPWISSPSPLEELTRHEELLRLKTILSGKQGANARDIRTRELVQLQKRINILARRLVAIFEEDRTAVDKLLRSLHAIYKETENNLLQKAVTNVDDTTKQHIQNEIRQIFQRYDLFRKPRSFIYKIMRFPLSFLGLGPGSDEEKRKRDLAKLHKKINLKPLHLAVEDLNRRIHNEIRIAEIGYLQDVLLKRNLGMSVSEIDTLFFEKQAELERWLQEQFMELTKGIPRHKEWGIYSTTILWSIFLVSIETVLGGGLSFFEAILDSVIVPFLSKGAVEIFAYQELKKIAEQLDQRYKKQLRDVLGEQYLRYVTLLESCAASGEKLKQMKNLLGSLNS